MISISLSLILLLLLTLYINSNGENVSIDHKIAIAVQGKVTELNDWITVWNLMKMHSNVSSLFLLSYDIEINDFYNKYDNNIIYIHKPNTTWTSGRNSLLMKIHHEEERKQIGYKYLLFADSDMLFFTCDETPTTYNKFESAAFCLNRFIQMYLLSSISFAQVSYLGKLSRPTEFYKFDCSDAKFVAIHHAAVPILLPYVEKLDYTSWWESQRILWRVASGCIPFSGVGNGMLNIKEELNQHVPYPKTQDIEKLSQVISNIYGNLGLSPNPIDNSTFNTVQGDCANQDNMILNRENRPLHSIPTFYSNQNEILNRKLQFDNDTIELSMKWRTTNTYHYCLSVLKQRYHDYVKNSKLD